MKKENFIFTAAIFILLFSFDSKADACIFAGSSVKCLKDSLQFSPSLNRYITGDTDDPSAVAKDGIAGDVYIRSGTAEMYIKTDSGVTLNWTLQGGGGGGGGDVVGPASAVVNSFAFFDATTGKLISDNGGRATYIPGAVAQYNFLADITGVGGDWAGVRITTDKDNDQKTDIRLYSDTSTPVVSLEAQSNWAAVVIGDGEAIPQPMLIFNGLGGQILIQPPNPMTGQYFLTLPPAGPLVANQILESDASGNLSWINTPTGGGGGALNDLTDVTLATPVDGQTLVYEASTTQWKNQTVSLGGGGDVTSLATSTTNQREIWDIIWLEGYVCGVEPVGNVTDGMAITYRRSGDTRLNSYNKNCLNMSGMDSNWEQNVQDYCNAITPNITSNSCIGSQGDPSDPEGIAVNVDLFFESLDGYADPLSGFVPWIVSRTASETIRMSFLVEETLSFNPFTEYTQNSTNANNDMFSTSLVQKGAPTYNVEGKFAIFADNTGQVIDSLSYGIPTTIGTDGQILTVVNSANSSRALVFANAGGFPSDGGLSGLVLQTDGTNSPTWLNDGPSGYVLHTAGNNAGLYWGAAGGSVSYGGAPAVLDIMVGTSAVNQNITVGLPSTTASLSGEYFRRFPDDTTTSDVFWWDVTGSDSQPVDDGPGVTNYIKIDVSASASQLDIQTAMIAAMDGTTRYTGSNIGGGSTIVLWAHDGRIYGAATYTGASGVAEYTMLQGRDDGDNIETTTSTMLAPGSMTGLYFTLDTTIGTEVVWYDVSGADSPPSIGAFTYIRVDVSGASTSADVGAATLTAIQNFSPGLSGSWADPTFTFSNKYYGEAVDQSGVTTGLAVAVTVQGVTAAAPVTITNNIAIYAAEDGRTISNTLYSVPSAVGIEGQVLKVSAIPTELEWGTTGVTPELEVLSQTGNLFLTNNKTVSYGTVHSTTNGVVAGGKLLAGTAGDDWKWIAQETGVLSAAYTVESCADPNVATPLSIALQVEFGGGLGSVVTLAKSNEAEPPASASSHMNVSVANIPVVLGDKIAVSYNGVCNAGDSTGTWTFSWRP